MRREREGRPKGRDGRTEGAGGRELKVLEG